MTMIFIASDHAALEAKSKLIQFLENKNTQVTDLGPITAARCDYPDYAKKVAAAVLKTPQSLGILCCGSGIGMSIQANRYKGVRAALVWDEESASLAKAHNNANILCLGARLHSQEKLEKMIMAWLDGHFENRHQPRLDKLDA